MELDPIAEVGATRRGVETTVRDDKPAKVVVAERTYPTTVEDLWDALTNPERIPRWFLPIEGDLRPGGRFQLEGHAGGEVLACDAPTSLEVTWESGGQTSWVTVTLTADGAEATKLELRHTHPVDDFWHEYGPGAVGIGWDLLLAVGLDRHVRSGGQPVDRQEAEAWQTSPEAHVFVKAASDAWRDAAIAAGEDAAAATTAAERTAAFYTGSTG